MAANSRLRFTTPPELYIDGLPVGNGVVGAMVLGTPARGRLALNHEWLWRSTHRRRGMAPRAHHLPEIRRLFLEGRTREAGELAIRRLSGIGGRLKVERNLRNRVAPYQPAGDLWIEFGDGDTDDYERSLDLSTGVATARWTSEGARLTQTCFAHFDLPLICLRLAAEDEGALDLTARLDRVHDQECSLSHEAGDDRLRLFGHWDDGSRFCVVARLLAEGGEIEFDEAGTAARVKGARALAILASIGVAHDGQEPAPLAEAALINAPDEWEELVEVHGKRFGEWYDRVSLRLGGDEDADDEPTDRRLERVKNGRTDNGLMATFFNFGRYLLIASSRPGGLPANLQGVWNEDIDPPWQCDFHHDVNLEMNYWPAEACALPECAEPLLDHLERLADHGRQVARDLYGAEGIYLPLTSDCWPRATPEAYVCDVWTGAAAWLAQHFWWRYEYGGDLDFLGRRAYPFIREVARFYETFLVRDDEGRLVTAPSQSPENTFEGGTTPVSICMAATMDLELIHDVLTHAIEASRILDTDGDKRDEWRRILEEIPPLQVGRHGQLQEWLEDYEEPQPGHRHVSHLVGLYPGDRLTPEDTPELTQAARVSLERRLSNKGAHTGWSRAWTVCLWARLREGEEAARHLSHLVTEQCAGSLLDLHPYRDRPGNVVFQIDGNFGATAGVAEMLLQSHRGRLRLLPAIPEDWASGSFRGLRARGGFDVDCAWEEGRPRQATIRSRLGGSVDLRWEGGGAPDVRRDDEAVETENEKGRARFATEAGAAYEIEWAY